MSSASKTLIFSYGSNSTAQLRARVRNPKLATSPAVLPGYSRVFCLAASRWGGGVASLAPSPVSGVDPGDPEGAGVRGLVAELSADELLLLDAFEGGYRKEPVAVRLLAAGASGGAPTARARAYIAGVGPPGAPWTPALTQEPSEAYLVAIHGMLREHAAGGGAAVAIAVRGFDAATGRAGPRLRTWAHPGARSLGLRALCVEVALAQPEAARWEMPAECAQFEEALGRAGVRSGAQLAFALSEAPGALNKRLAAAGAGAFSSEVLRLLEALLGCGGGGGWRGSGDGGGAAALSALPPPAPLPASAPHYFFFYGSLRRGFCNHRRLAEFFGAEGCRFVGAARSAVPAYLFGLRSRAYPILTFDVRGAPAGVAPPVPVVGEVFAVDPGAKAGIQRLDAFEGVSFEGGYARALADFALLGGGHVRAWAYAKGAGELWAGAAARGGGGPPHLVLVEGGDWAAMGAHE
jgi:gamma-glutamylcyclotransferase (GGCT)/AIG2-like uncharacterized protein YtfP